MNIAMVSEHANPLARLGTTDAGGQNVYVAALAEALVRAGNCVSVYTRRDSRDAQAEVRAPGGYVVRTIEAGPLRPIPKDDIYEHLEAFATSLRRLVADDRPDVMHAHFWMSGLAAVRACESLDVPVVQTFHALGSEKRRHQGADDSSPSLRVADEARLARSVDCIVSTTGEELVELCRQGADPSRIRIVPCGIDIALFTGGAPFTRPRTQTHRIVTLSRLVPRKGVDDAIAALAHLPDTELLVAGGGECDELGRSDEVARLREAARACGVAERVFFVGRLDREAVPGFLRSADALVAAAWYEPFGIVPVEAMACGIPVVATAVGGQKDTIVDGLTGFHVPPHAPQAIAAGLERLLASASLRARLGAAGRRRARTRYTWTHVANEISGIYRTVERSYRTVSAHSA
ncbi:MAG: glycosyltransferase family 1 protein [Vulcanimicrobiaceae bacterium]